MICRYFWYAKQQAYTETVTEIPQVVRYKVLDKDGNYFNVDAYIKDAVDVSSGSRSSDDVFCPYKITRSGEYSIIAKGLYCEKLRNEHGRSANAIVPISYRIDGKKMTLLFRLGNNVYREVYQKVSKLGKWVRFCRRRYSSISVSCSGWNQRISSSLLNHVICLRE